MDDRDEVPPEGLPRWGGDEQPPWVVIPVRGAEGAAARDAARLQRVAARLALTGEPLGYVTIVETDDVLARAHLVETDARRELAATIVEVFGKAPKP